MKVSVAIPAYNSTRIIRPTLESVLNQSAPADEILVMDDGSTDETVSLLRSYGPRVTVLQQKNSGVAPSRNVLAQRATGDLVAFLDHDDIWHPKYLETRRALFEKYPDAAAFYSGHLDFETETHQWSDSIVDSDAQPEFMSPLEFLERYSHSTGLFGSMSFCAVPKRTLEKMGGEPFKVSGVEDSYFGTTLPLIGSVVFSPAQLAGYRVSSASLSANRLRSRELWVQVYQLLEQRYRAQNDAQLRDAFLRSFALTLRRHGMLLMGAGRVAEARRQFLASVKMSSNPASMCKALALWLTTFSPSFAQPSWPSGDRQSGDNMMSFNPHRKK